PLYRTSISTLSLHDALPIFPRALGGIEEQERVLAETGEWAGELRQVTKTQTTVVVESRWKLRRDGCGKPKFVLMVNKEITHRRKDRKSTRLNSSHQIISYAV